MKKSLIFVLALLIYLGSSFCYAQEYDGFKLAWTPLQVSLFPPVELPPSDAVFGARANLLYGKIKSVYGLDVGIIQHTTEKNVGVQAGAANWANDITGVQASPFLNIAGDSLFLVQFGGYGVSYAGKINGIQWGSLFIRANKITGVQLGFVQMADEMEGIQCGDVSYAGSGGGVQLGGLFSRADNFNGFQYGGLANYSGTVFSGVQFSSFSNYSNDAGGVQFTMIYNRAISFSGIQISYFLNDVISLNRGVQIGLLNSAAESKGFQVGLINKSKSRILPLINWPD